jgi:hypothetical protein
MGTWNLEGRWSADHRALLEGQDCDVWLLTEVPTDASIHGMRDHRTAEAMAPRKSWAGIFSRVEATTRPDPHPATAMALCDGFRLIAMWAYDTGRAGD